MATKKPAQENVRDEVQTVKENLLALHKILLDLNVRSIGDLEVLISRA